MRPRLDDAPTDKIIEDINRAIATIPNFSITVMNWYTLQSLQFLKCCGIKPRRIKMQFLWKSRLKNKGIRRRQRN